MFASVLSAAILGMEVRPILVEADVSDGLPSFTMVGFPSAQVKEAQENESYGKYVVVDHGNGIETLYAHCSELLVQSGDTVSRETPLAKVGQTGKATAAHLHLELHLQGEYYDPQPLLGGSYV